MNPTENVENAENPENNTLTLISKEKESFQVPLDVAIKSSLVRTMWEGDRSETKIPLLNVRSAILAKVIEFLTHHRGVPFEAIAKPLKSTHMREIVPEWDSKFVELDLDTLFELILAANYMDIKELLDLTCAKVATMIKGKSIEQIRETFDIENDFTDEELKAVKSENNWANVE